MNIARNLGTYRVSEINTIQSILNKGKKRKLFYACGKTYALKEEFASREWDFCHENKRWQYLGYADDPNVSHFLDNLDYDKHQAWIKSE